MGGEERGEKICLLLSHGGIGGKEKELLLLHITARAGIL